MQNIQSPLGSNIHPLGILSSLSNSHRMLFRKESHSLNLQSNFISSIQTKSPLVTSSKFFLSREHEPSIQPLIGWDSWDNQDINSDFSLLEFDSSDSITPPENSNEPIKDSILEIMPTRIEKNTSNDVSSEINIKGKSKSKKTNKSQQPPEKKSKPKSKTKKTVKLSVAKNVEQFVDESNVPISFNENSLLASDEPLSAEANSQLTPLQLDIASDFTTTDNDSVNIITTSTSPNIEDKSIFLKNITNNSQQLNSELPSMPSTESSVTESILISPKEINLDDSISERREASPIELTLPNNLEQTVIPYINFSNNEQQIITEASESVNISDIPVSPTPPQQDIKYQVPSIVDNQSTTSQKKLIQKKEVSPTVNSSSHQEESPYKNRNFEVIPAIEPDLISESTANDFDKDNSVADNFLDNVALSSTLTPLDVNDENIIGADSFKPKADVAVPNSESSVALSSAFTLPNVDDAPTLVHTLVNDENIIGADSFTPKVDVAVPNSEASVVKSPITLQQEIDSSVTSESPVSAPVQLTPTSANIEDTSSLFRNSDSNEQLVTSESQSAIAVNVSDVSANMNSLEHDSNIENTTSESTENKPILALPEISETERITATSSEIVEATVVNATSPEIVEATVVNATSPEIVETQLLSATSPEIVEATVVNATSPEIIEAPVVTDTLSEIAEAERITATSPEIAETQVLRATSPEIVEATVVNATSPEIIEAPVVNATSPEIAEAERITATSPEIIEAPVVNATSPEIAEAERITATSPEIAETQVLRATSPEIVEATVLRATSPEIIEAPVVNATSPEIIEAPVVNATSPEIAEAERITATSPEIAETQVLRATSPEIIEATVVNATSPEIIEAPVVNATSPEIAEAERITATLPEIAETQVLRATSPEIVEATVVNATSPEIIEAPVVNATSPEIVEAPVVNATSPEIIEAPVVNATSPEIVEAPVVNATSPEIIEAPVVNATSPEIVETESIFREIIDNEQPVESEFPFAVTNPEISTFVDTSDNPDIPEELTSSQNEVSTPPKVEQNTTVENLPAPKGYATGGHVTDSHVENRQQIAPSDTVPAMLTPGEFVINTRDAQKNLPLLHHINTGGTPHDIILPSLQTPNPQEPEEKTSLETPTKVDSFPDTSLQLKSAETNPSQISNPLSPSSLGLDIGKQKLSILNSPQLNPLQNETIHVDEPSPQYSSPPLIFRKTNPSSNTSSQWSNTPSQWSSVEDLLNGNNDEFTSFNFNDGESNNQNSKFSHVSESPQVFAKHLPAFRGFAGGGEVTPPDISREIEPITETIENASSSSEEGDKDDTANLEALAREIYNRLRQRIEIERERHGGYSGRLPW